MKVTAVVPGKVIISGEHSVVYERLALSCTIGLKVVVVLTTTDDCQMKDNCIVFGIPALQRTLSLTSHDRDLLFNQPFEFTLEHIQNDFKMLSSCLEHILKDWDGAPLAAAKIFCYLLAAIMRQQTDVFLKYSELKFELAGDLPLSSGLGSSASLAVGLAAVMESLVHNISAITEERRASINRWAFFAEQFAHGKASGLDNFTVVHGGLVEAQGAGNFINRLLPSSIVDNLSVMLIDSGVPKSTRTSVANVRSFVDKFPPLAHHIFDAMESAAIEVKRCLFGNVGNDPKIEEANSSALQDVLNVNHCLLKALGVSHAVLDEIVALCNRFGIGAKLTGGGGGGMVLVLYDRRYLSEKIQQLQLELTKRGFKTYSTCLTNNGLELA